MLLGFRLFGWFLALLTLVSVAIAAAVALALLTLVGSVDECGGEGRLVVVSAELSSAFQSKWDNFNAILNGGSPGTVEFNESEVTSRAISYLEGRDAPIEDLKVCIYAGEGEASGKIDTPFFGRKVSVRAKGTLDLSGAQPEVEVTDIRVGGAPGFLSGLIEGFVGNLIDDQLEEIELEHRYSLDLTDGIATVGGQP